MLGPLLNSLFGVAYIKNLKSSVNRKEHIEKECKDINLQYSIVEAIKGTDICDSTFTLQHGPFHLTYPSSAGFIGNQKTSALIIQKAFDTLCDAAIMLDDDCVFAHTANISSQTLENIATVPHDWDIIILGKLSEPILTTQNVTYVKCQHHPDAAGSHGIAVNRKIMPELIDIFNGTDFLGDGAIGRLIDLNKNVYLMHPGVCSQDRTIFSDINKFYHN
jgi:GR25 family glycosyltransferase involved in LPS biosynthesis